LRESLRQEVPEFRRAQALGYPPPGLISLVVMAAAQGVVRGPKDLADYADTMSQPQWRALGFRSDPHTGEIRRPKKTTFARLLRRVDGDGLERVLLRWQDQILGPRQDRIIIFDGKKVRHAGVEIVNAVDSQGRFLGSVVTESKSNEIPAARQLLRRQNLLGKILVADALHSQDETGQQIVFEGGGDYLLTVKANQPTLQTNLENLFVKQSFSPSAHAQDAGVQAGAQPGPVGNPASGLPGSSARSGGLSGSPPGGAIRDTDQTKGQMVSGSRSSGEQFHFGRTPSRGDALP